MIQTATQHKHPPEPPIRNQLHVLMLSNDIVRKTSAQTNTTVISHWHSRCAIHPTQDIVEMTRCLAVMAWVIVINRDFYSYESVLKNTEWN